MKKKNSSQKDGVVIVTVENPQLGVAEAKDILYKQVNGETLLLLSGGSTPKNLYEKLALEKTLGVGAVAMVDERPGVKDHAGSNERMIKGTGLLGYLHSERVNFYPIIEHGKTKQEAVDDYDKTIKSLFATFAKKVAIVGVGEDGHTAGIPVGGQSSESAINGYVAGYSTFPSEPKERISLTFEALDKVDLLIILAFGTSKQEPLRKMFEKGPTEEIPARFYLKPEIAGKTLLITDQKV